MNFGLYLPLLALMACLQHCQTGRQHAISLALPAAAAMGLTLLISQLLGNLGLALLQPLTGPTPGLPAIIILQSATALSLAWLLNNKAGNASRALGLRPGWLLANNLLLSLPGSWMSHAPASLGSSMQSLLLSVLLSLLLAVFACLPTRLARSRLPAMLRDLPALWLCALLLALALHSLGARLS
ncbi:hypothetical protein [Aquitalea pelogenes]|uniref:hypothetical protein n=1 Tax=Aquitalea pelogenes TaxID=1293573 RepID=UPI0007894DF0|nr:hypothetical protein [Aquitalea pelogenes]